MNAVDALRLLAAAMAEHEASYPDGDWKSANDRIEAARDVADAVINQAGKWPRRGGLNLIGNGQAVRLLQEIAADG